jgi:para-nitrobenzyl esterase
MLPPPSLPASTDPGRRSEEHRMVRTTSGQLRGNVRDGVHEFLGVPYAAPPVGPLRFRAPVHPAPWDGERDATHYGAVATQQPVPGIFGEVTTPRFASGDDCLNLNIWTPALGAAALPVLVWIHGGGFFAGSGTEEYYDGTNFARHGVVCVTINYRLGIEGFGHFSEHFPELVESGNAGLLDQIAALKWVQENIAAFGGDPGNVTIAGESAGGMSVGTLLASPQASGLFRRAIPQSGAAHNAISAPTASLIAGYVLDHLGIAPGDLDALQAVRTDAVVETQIKLMTELAQTRDPVRFREAAATGLPFQPAYGTAVLPVRPIEAIAAGSAAGIDVMVGTTLEEGLVLIVDLADLFNEPLIEATLEAFMAASGRRGSDALDVYRGNRPGVPPHVLAAAVETDRMFRIPAIRLAEAHARHGSNTWMYQFCWRSTAHGGQYGACHMLEVPFVFHQVDGERIRRLAGDPPDALADAVHGAWVAFAQTGNPNHAGLPTWPRYDTERRATLRFDTVCDVVDDPAADERAVWDGVV